MSAILGGGLHVGVLLHGKKVGDDNRTLHQSGISCEENLDSLGFMLEPNLTQFRASEHTTLLESSSAPEIVTSRARCVCVERVLQVGLEKSCVKKMLAFVST